MLYMCVYIYQSNSEPLLPIPSMYKVGRGGGESTSISNSEVKISVPPNEMMHRRDIPEIFYYLWQLMAT